METNTKLPDYSGITNGKWEIQEASQINHVVYSLLDGNRIDICCTYAGTVGEEQSEANAQAIASLPDLIKENEELHKAIKYAEKVSFETSKENAALIAKCESYAKDYNEMVKEVLRLSRENSKMKEMIGERIKELEQ